MIDEQELHVLSVRMHGAVWGRDGPAHGRAQARSAAARTVTCAVLGRYLGMPAAQLPWGVSKYGKPRLAGSSDVRFNLSHSGDVLVIALATGVEVGVDVEHVRPMPCALPLARRFFRPEEVEQLERESQTHLDRAFFHCWTQKEAYLKAIGLGLHADLQSVRVACDPLAPASIEWIAEDEAACWQMHGWQPAPGYTAAVALRHRGMHLRIFAMVQEADLLAGEWPVSRDESA